MIRLYDKDNEINISNNADLNEVLEMMEEIDEAYKNRKEIPAEFVTIHKDSLYYSLLYIIENELTETRTLKDGIKFWEKFSDKQQSLILEKFVKKISNKKLFDEEIREWIYSTANIQRRYL